MTTFLQTLTDGVTVGSLYALIALGYTMVYGILQFINFAHGDVVMLGGWIAYVAATRLLRVQPTMPGWLAGGVVLGIGMLSCAIIGYLIERLAYRPLRNAPRLNVLITAIGVSLFLENAGQLKFIFGANPQPMPALLPSAALASVAGVNFYAVDVIAVGTAVVLMLALERLVYASRLGLAMRAVSYDHRLASLMGVPVDRVIALTFVAGSALAAAAGFLFALKYHTLQQPAHTAWTLLGLKAFVAAVVGGIGNIRGAMLGGLLIGLLENFGVVYVSADLRDVYVFAVLIVVLLVRPWGLLGRPTVEKV